MMNWLNSTLKAPNPVIKRKLQEELDKAMAAHAKAEANLAAAIAARDERKAALLS